MASTPETLYRQLKEELGEQRTLPVDDWQPVVNGRIAIRIDGDGRWFHEREQIRRPELVRLFSRILRRDEDGYVLVTPAERLLIEVDDVPFQAVDFEAMTDATGAATDLIFTTNVGDLVRVDRDHPLWMSNTPAHRPYVRVRQGLDARITRAAYYRLLDVATVKDDRVMVGSGGMQFLLGSAV
ncbi:MAG: DUF1285 domain-containing protein [Pseudomonadota bacterium]